jgi:hypothetical protein
LENNEIIDQKLYLAFACSDDEEEEDRREIEHQGVRRLPEQKTEEL